MTQNYSPLLPIDKNGNVKTGYPPAKVALASSYRDSAAVSSILLLTHDTTEIEVSASTGTLGIAGKWLSQATVDSSVAGTSVITGLTTGNFDFVVPSGWVMRYVVPVAKQGNSASIQGVNRAEGLYPAVAFKTVSGVGSVLTAEF